MKKSCIFDFLSFKKLSLQFSVSPPVFNVQVDNNLCIVLKHDSVLTTS
jgi:hypothetical protein